MTMNDILTNWSTVAGRHPRNPRDEINANDCSSNFQTIIENCVRDTNRQSGKDLILLNPHNKLLNRINTFRYYLWMECRYNSYNNIPVSLSAFVNLDRASIAHRANAWLQLNVHINDFQAQANANYYRNKYHSHLSLPLSDGLIYCCTAQGAASQPKTIDRIEAFKYTLDNPTERVEVSKIIPMNSDWDDLIYQQAIKDAILALEKYYDQIILPIH